MSTLTSDVNMKTHKKRFISEKERMPFGDLREESILLDTFDEICRDIETFRERLDDAINDARRFNDNLLQLERDKFDVITDVIRLYIKHFG